MMNKGPVIEAHDLAIRRGGTPVLRGLGFSLPAGRTIGLLGPSGSGKSTLMRAVTGSQVITSGSVTVLGQPAGGKGLRHRIGYMTQAASIYEDLSVRQNLTYFARILRLDASEVERVIGITDLSGQSERLVSGLSGGQRNRVSLAVALLGAPPVLVLDEPTVGLDPVLRSQLWRVFAGLAASGTCLLVSSHVMEEAMRCDDLLLLREGRLLAHLSPGELMESTGAATPELAFLELIARQQDATDGASAVHGGRHRRRQHPKRGGRP
ncbi:ABC transporter ATP-binding protein [Glutamicibacter sp. MNS18]|uniref:ABC transporter ATP-binding protein n=1 Tax=Glutamicibacter sp. MNS18 TaxID=2989817 RepID=UPI0022359B17|nr:ABC transporter ATP-binding protein [Glutamicibacter sp. MNS18]MCW4466013.1 ABC transporter ATP-binding protein [Glutamicibacter sp. MNS18]